MNLENEKVKHMTCINRYVHHWFRINSFLRTLFHMKARIIRFSWIRMKSVCCIGWTSVYINVYLIINLYAVFLSKSACKYALILLCKCINTHWDNRFHQKRSFNQFVYSNSSVIETSWMKFVVQSINHE